MSADWTIECSTHIKTPTKGSMVEIVVSSGETRFARYFPLADINTSPVVVFRWLGECGIAATSDTRKAVARALSSLPDPVDGWVAETPGWYGKLFALPSGTIGRDGHHIINLMTGVSADKWQRRGTLRQWRSKVARPLAASPVAAFSLCAALTGPVLQLANTNSIVFMIVGPNSMGKSTLLEVCGSVWGGGGDKSFTDTFLKSPEEFEVAALQHRDTLLTLDETKLLGTSELDAAQKFSKILFRYSSEKPKDIFRHETSRQSIRGVRLFTSNESAAQLLRRANLPYEGQEAVRVLEIKVNPDDFPVFSFDGSDTAQSAARVDRFKRRSRKYAGEASQRFLRRLVKDRSADEIRLRKRIRKYIQEGLALFSLPAHADSMYFRMAHQVAIVYAAGRLAYRYKVLPFNRKTLRQTFKFIWKKIQRQVAKNIGHDPIREFVKNLNESLERLVDLDKGMPTLTRSEAKKSRGFKKTRQDGRLAIYLPSQAFARLAPAQQLVLRWLEERGFLQRDGSSKTSGKRQVKSVIAHDPDGRQVRLRVYLLVGDISEIRRTVGGVTTRPEDG